MRIFPQGDFLPQPHWITPQTQEFFISFKYKFSSFALGSFLLFSFLFILSCITVTEVYRSLYVRFYDFKVAPKHLLFNIWRQVNIITNLRKMFGFESERLDYCNLNGGCITYKRQMIVSHLFLGLNAKLLRCISQIMLCIYLIFC